MTTKEAMNTNITIARVVGVVYLAGFVVGIGGNILIQSVLGAPDRLSTVSANSMLLAIGTLLPGAIVAAVGFEVLQVVSGVYVGHALKGMSATYGMFAIVLGALAWIFLQARVVVYAAEVNVVRHDRLWPRSLVTATDDTDATTEDADADDDEHDDEDDGARRAVGT